MQESKVKTGGRQISNCFVGSVPTAARIFYYPEYRRNVRTAGACNFAPFCVPW